MDFSITSGKIDTAVKVCIYGPEGVGKTTLAAQFPEPLFIDTEGGTKYIDVNRLPAPTSWGMLLEEIKYILQNTHLCKTLVIDTLDWAEMLCVNAILAKYQKKGIEDFGYGKGYIYAKEEFGRFLNLLEDIIEKGINVVVTAHAKIVKFEQPEESGAYDMWTLKLGQKTGSQTTPLVKEWCDMLLFCNYKIISVAADDTGKKYKAQGGKRVIYTMHSPCWDAKNRHGLPDEIPMEYKSIAQYIPGIVCSKPIVEQSQIEQTQIEQIEPQQTITAVQSQKTNGQDNIPKHLKDLFDLMNAFNASTEEVQAAVTAKGYYPADTPIENYDPNFVEGVLVDAWTQVFAIIENNRKTKTQKGE